MSEIVSYDKVTSVLLQHGEWYEVDPGTFREVSATNFLGGNPGTSGFAWKSRNASLACPCNALVLVRYTP
jgi:hypothetical protein